MSHGSSTRSAGRATSSVLDRIPIRWRLAGGSALLTLVILCGFAVAVGALTAQRIHDDFEQEVREAADRLSDDVEITPIDFGAYKIRFRPNLNTFVAGDNAVARLIGARSCSPACARCCAGVPRVARARTWSPTSRSTPTPTRCAGASATSS